MKITPVDVERIIRLTSAEDSSGLRRALEGVLTGIWDRGHTQALTDFKYEEYALFGGTCPYTQSHTRDWCGYEGCKES